MAAQINGQLEVGAPAALSYEPISIPDLRQRWLDHHEHVRRSSLQTIRRYRAATEHLLNFVEKACPIRHASDLRSRHATDFVRHLRTIKVAPNGQTKEGRKVGGRLNNRDVSSDYCRRQKNLILERLDKYDSEEDAWQEVLVEDKHAGPADTAITRIDFSTWLQFLPRRLRKIATFLATGETTSATAKRFHLSQGRISQIRKELFLAWHRFQGDEPALATA
jgi:hypothetical protein